MRRLVALISPQCETCLASQSTVPIDGWPGKRWIVSKEVRPVPDVYSSTPNGPFAPPRFLSHNGMSYARAQTALVRHFPPFEFTISPRAGRSCENSNSRAMVAIATSRA